VCDTAYLAAVLDTPRTLIVANEVALTTIQAKGSSITTKAITTSTEPTIVGEEVASSSTPLVGIAINKEVVVTTRTITAPTTTKAIITTLESSTPVVCVCV
jgi:hypothetical protein